MLQLNGKKLPKTSDPRTFWALYGVMLLIVLLLALGNQRTVSTVLATGRDGTPETPAVSDHDDLSTELETRDSLVEVAQQADRDPFRVPRAPATTTRTTTRQPPPARVEPAPTLRTLLFDTVNPSVQLRLGDESSGWLQTGDQFQGWTVIEITENSVTVIKGSRSLVLGSQ